MSLFLQNLKKLYAFKQNGKKSRTKTLFHLIKIYYFTKHSLYIGIIFLLFLLSKIKNVLVFLSTVKTTVNIFEIFIFGLIIYFFILFKIKNFLFFLTNDGVYVYFFRKKNYLFSLEPWNTQKHVRLTKWQRKLKNFTESQLKMFNGSI